VNWLGPCIHPQVNVRIDAAGNEAGARVLVDVGRVRADDGSSFHVNGHQSAFLFTVSDVDPGTVHSVPSVPVRFPGSVGRSVCCFYVVSR